MLKKAESEEDNDEEKLTATVDKQSKTKPVDNKIELSSVLADNTNLGIMQLMVENNQLNSKFKLNLQKKNKYITIKNRKN